MPEDYVKFTCSEKATKFCEISTLLLSVCTVGGDFAKFCGLLRIYELYLRHISDKNIFMS